MIISFEGLAGCQKDKIFQGLKTMGIEIFSAQNAELLDLLWQQPDRYALTYELDQLVRNREYINRAEGDGQPWICCDSIYALKEVYVEYLMNQKLLDRVEADIFNRLHYLLKIQPDVIIYFYGDIDKCHARQAETGPKKWSLEEFRGLYAQYEWVFDVNNCFLKIFKINVEEDLDLIMKTLLEIFNQLQDYSLNLNESSEGSGSVTPPLNGQIQTQIYPPPGLEEKEELDKSLNDSSCNK